MIRPLKLVLSASTNQWDQITKFTFQLECSLKRPILKAKSHPKRKTDFALSRRKTLQNIFKIVLGTIYFLVK